MRCLGCGAYVWIKTDEADQLCSMGRCCFARFVDWAADNKLTLSFERRIGYSSRTVDWSDVATNVARDQWLEAGAP